MAMSRQKERGPVGAIWSVEVVGASTPTRYEVVLMVDSKEVLIRVEMRSVPLAVRKGGDVKMVWPKRRRRED